MPKFTSAALNWLLLVLEERFGHTFTLEQGQSGLKLSLNNVSQGYILFPKLEEAFHLSRSDFPCSQWDAAKNGWLSILGIPLLMPCISELSEPLIEQKEDHFVINYDILGLTYWMLNRIEEIDRTDLDNHSRFPATASHAYKNGYLERPIVDEWLHILGQVIQCTWSMLELKEHQFTINVSHDVDAPSCYGFSSAKDILRAMVGDIIKRRDFRGALAAPLIRLKGSKRLHPADKLNTFDWIMAQSEKNNLVSAFYFICGRTDPSKDANYEPEHPAIRNLMNRIHMRGHEIGLHPSYDSYQSPKIIQREADRLRTIMQEEGIVQNVLGGRMHYLRWEHPATLQAWNDAGMTYETTLGYADLPGFRCGTCFEYPAFNPKTQKILRIRIRPLLVMESTIISSRYLNLGFTDVAERRVLRIKDRCLKVNGCFTLLWHNSYFTDKNSFGLYKGIISQ